MSQTPSAAALLHRAFPAVRTLSDAELHRLVDELEHRLRPSAGIKGSPQTLEQRVRPAPAAHYSVGDYLKYEMDA